LILLGDKLISEDIIEKNFICNLSKCAGACCVKGDAGAPLTKTEVDTIAEQLPTILKFIDPKGAELIRQEGFMIQKEDEIETNCLPTGECVFVKYEDGTATCGIESANNEYNFDFKKPLSCHLYPIRVSQVGDYTALNYHKWDICSPACAFGDKEKVPVYRFLKEAIVRGFGEETYLQLDAYAKSLEG
jgi:hypothetical protein